MEVRRAGNEEELVDQESEDLRGPEAQRHAQESGSRDQQRAGEKEKEEVLAARPGASPISPPAVREWRPEWIPAHLSNGLIGLRVGRIPLVEGLCIVGGLAAVDPVEQAEGFARGPYPIAGDLELDGRKLSRAPGKVQLLEQRYDFSRGELSSRFAFHGERSTATVDVLTFCSRSLPLVVLQQVQVEVDNPTRLSVTAKVDPSGIEGRWLSRETRTPGSEQPVVDGSLLWAPHGGLSTCGASYITEFEGGDGVERRREEQDQLAALSTSYSVDARPGRRYVLRQYASLVASQMHHEPHRQAARLAGMAIRRGFQNLRDENRDAWEEIWKGRIRLVGAQPRWQAAADAAYYYLHASAHSSSLFSTSMFGLAYWPNYHYYRGHVMWDIESFAFPTLLLTAPEAARGLLAFRFERMQAAEKNAAMFGYRGLQFPWAAGPRHGEEVIRLSAPQIVFEQHVTLSVALAFAQYVHATGDQDYLRERAWPILEGVANWVVSRAQKTSRGYEIKDVIGVAEKPTRSTTMPTSTWPPAASSRRRPGLRGVSSAATPTIGRALQTVSTSRSIQRVASSATTIGTRPMKRVPPPQRPKRWLVSFPSTAGWIPIWSGRRSSFTWLGPASSLARRCCPRCSASTPPGSAIAQRHAAGSRPVISTSSRNRSPRPTSSVVPNIRTSRRLVPSWRTSAAS
jgi:glycosyl hydrolase family 65